MPRPSEPPKSDIRPAASPSRQSRSLWHLVEIFAVALRLGLTSFGGPIAHLGYFREEYVARRKWLDDKTYADLVALCQFLPGPASSQTGISIGMLRGGLPGGIAAWIGFTLPSAVALSLLAVFLQGYQLAEAGWLRGLLVAAVVVVAHAVWGMARRLTPDRTRVTLALVAAGVVLMLPTAYTQILVIIAAGLFGWRFLKPLSDPEESPPVTSVPFGPRVALTAWVLFFALLAGLPLIRHIAPGPWMSLTDSLYRVGSLVFGGGHVVLPLLNAEVVSQGLLTDTQFLAGYGAAQAVPGPMFTFAAYLGAAIDGWGLAALATAAIFLPSFLLVVGALPFWDAIRRRAAFKAVLGGVNAAVAGILLAALYDPIWTKAILTPADFTLALAGFGLLMFWKVPAWAVVLLCAAGGMLIATV